MASTVKILATLGTRQANAAKELSNEVTDSLDAPQLKPKPGADMGKKVADILGSSMTQQYTPMD